MRERLFTPFADLALRPGHVKPLTPCAEEPIGGSDQFHTGDVKEHATRSVAAGNDDDCGCGIRRWLLRIELYTNRVGLTKDFSVVGNKAHGNTSRLGGETG